jgi:hypothetical protein
MDDPSVADYKKFNSQKLDFDELTSLLTCISKEISIRPDAEAYLGSLPKSPSALKMTRYVPSLPATTI